ncbi:MAG: hypothetical protein WCP28_14980 [Actinomycetes bacterium]
MNRLEILGSGVWVHGGSLLDVELTECAFVRIVELAGRREPQGLRRE